jgi:hypothetical protein
MDAITSSSAPRSSTRSSSKPLMMASHKPIVTSERAHCLQPRGRPAMGLCA